MILSNDIILSIFAYIRKELLKNKNSDMANSDTEVKTVMEGQRWENGGWYTPIPPLKGPEIYRI